MSLGENILKLRSQKNMSQEELAAELGVSRQSVSKWETDASVPELDKLVRISVIFGVTLDELIFEKGNERVAEQKDTKPSDSKSSGNIRIIIGTILLCFGFTVFLLLTVLGGFLSGLIFSTPFLLCSLVCFFVKRFTVLWCLWSLYISVDLYLHVATGLIWTNVFFKYFYVFSAPVAITVTWILFLLFAFLCVITALCYRKDKIVLCKGNVIKTLALWILFFILPFALRVFGGTDIELIQTAMWRIFSATVHYIRTIVLVYACIVTARLLNSFVIYKRT